MTTAPLPPASLAPKQLLPPQRTLTGSRSTACTVGHPNPTTRRLVSQLVPSAGRRGSSLKTMGRWELAASGPPAVSSTCAQGE